MAGLGSVVNPRVCVEPSETKLTDRARIRLALVMLWVSVELSGKAFSRRVNTERRVYENFSRQRVVSFPFVRILDETGKPFVYSFE